MHGGRLLPQLDFVVAPDQTLFQRVYFIVTAAKGILVDKAGQELQHEQHLRLPQRLPYFPFADVRQTLQQLIGQSLALQFEQQDCPGVVCGELHAGNDLLEVSAAYFCSNHASDTGDEFAASDVLCELTDFCELIFNKTHKTGGGRRARIETKILFVLRITLLKNTANF